MSPPIVLRPLRTDELPWAGRHATLLNWCVLALALAIPAVLSPEILTRTLQGDRRYLGSIVQLSLFVVLMVYSTYSMPRVRAAQQLLQLIVTERDITLKRRSSGVTPEKIIWSVRRDEVGTIRSRAVGKHSQFTLQRRRDSEFRRFLQWAGVQDGKSLRAFSWVNDARTDPQNRPARLSDFSITTRKRMTADLWASDLGQALITAGYAPAQAKD